MGCIVRRLGRGKVSEGPLLSLRLPNMNSSHLELGYAATSDVREVKSSADLTREGEALLAADTTPPPVRGII